MNAEARRTQALLGRWASQAHRAVLFDFNGTLANDEPLVFKTFQELFASQLGFELEEAAYLEHFVGFSDREIIERAVAARGGGGPSLVEALLDERAARYRELVSGASPIEPSTRELVALLGAHRVPMGIVTGAQRTDVELVLDRAGLSGAFVTVVTVEDVSEGKPNPEGFLLAARDLGVGGSAVVVFEDTVVGLRAAHGAGMMAIGVVGTMGREELALEADAVIEGLGPQLFALVLDEVGQAEGS
jgi:beta-phosphoglucomutase